MSSSQYGLEPEQETGEGETSDDDLPGTSEDIDLEALAEEVYALLRQELRMERERRGWHKAQ